ncbi:MAG: sulfatase-like hydrolase/transferase [Planctomycetota bacterium]
MPPPDRPNLLLITTDQQRFDTLAPYKPAFLRTPHLDQLAHEGIRFDRAYADCPVCVPARVSIMSGRSALSHRLTTNGPSSSVLSSHNTLPHHLHQLGYHTAAIGKMHFSPQRNRHGFDEMILPEDYYRWVERAAYPHGPMRHGMGQCELEPAMSTLPEGLTLTSWIAEQSMDYIRHRRDPSRPFFLWCSFSKPHPPLDPPEPYWSIYRDADIPEPSIGEWSRDLADAPPAYRHAMQRQFSDTLSPDTLRAIRVAYYGLITHCDHAIGRLFAALQDTDLFENTLTVFCSDHGEYLGDHQGAGKCFPHDASARIPLVVRLPQTWNDRGHGTTCTSLASLSDLMPTFVHAAGGQTLEDCDGMDLVTLARRQIPPRDALVSVFGPREDPLHLTVTDGQTKYSYYPHGAAEQCFDLEQDPGETHNLAADPEHLETVNKLRARLVQELAEHAPDLLSGGALPNQPTPNTSTRDLRNQRWAGFHTEYHPVDVRH